MELCCWLDLFKILMIFSLERGSAWVGSKSQSADRMSAVLCSGKKYSKCSTRRAMTGFLYLSLYTDWMICFK
jgi:hypothetical protein